MIIVQTPLRLSLLGGNTDFPAYYMKYGGAVLTTTIDKYVYCIVTKRFDDEIWINYSEKEKVKEVAYIKHNLVREVLIFLKISEGIEITFLSDIPSEGSGLGSSSAVVIGLLNALHHYKNDPVTPIQLAKEACHIEIDILKKPIGIQDQFAIALGGCKKLKFTDVIDYMPLSDHFEKMFKNNLLLLYTNKTRKAEDILSKMKLDTDILNKNKELVEKGIMAMEYYDIPLFGKILNSYWKLKKQLNKHVSTDEIDQLYEKAKEHGALGGKIVGAGGGGFLLLVVPPEKRALVKKQLGLRELPFELSRYGSRVIFNTL